jgi:hypothetical protein
MTRLFLILLIFISSLANAQSSKQRLEDIEDKLDSIREEQEWRDFRNKVDRDGREFDRQMNELRDKQKRFNQQNQIENTNNSKITKQEPYRNKMDHERRVERASFWSLTMSEFLRRDEIGHTECIKYYDDDRQSCYISKMVNISFTEAEMRLKKSNKNCKSTNFAKYKDEIDEKKLMKKMTDCQKLILVFGK